MFWWKVLRGDRDAVQARHEGQAPEFDGVVYINEGFARSGSFVTVNITEAHHYDLVGSVLTDSGHLKIIGRIR